MRTIKELHCKSAFKLIYVTDNEMSDVIDYLEQDEISKKMENIIQKMSQIVKYVVLTVFEFRSCTNYMKQMKIENDFEFYDLLQHVTPRKPTTHMGQKIYATKSSKVDAEI